MRHGLVSYASAAVLLVGCSAVGGTSNPTAPANPTAPLRLLVAVGDVQLRVAVADTDAAREAGLRGRVVPPGTGMLFR